MGKVPEGKMKLNFTFTLISRKNLPTCFDDRLQNLKCIILKENLKKQNMFIISIQQ